MTRLKALLWGGLGAVLGLVLALGLLTLYQDHVLLRTLYQIEVQRSQTQGK